MDGTRFDVRLRRAEEVLARVSEGDFEQKLELSGENDALTGLEMGLNFLIVDLRTSAKRTREQQEALLLQQRELEAKLLMMEQRRPRFESSPRRCSRSGRTSSSCRSSAWWTRAARWTS